MLKNLLLLIFFGVLLISQPACKISNDEEAVVNVDPIFALDMVEDLQNDAELSFLIQSIEGQECLNYTIGQSLEKTTSNLNVSLNDIITPSDCIPGEAPAKADVALGYLPVGRVFNTEFRIKNTINNKGTLTINSDSYVLELESQDGFGSIVSKLNKISNNLIWGYVAYHDEDLVGDIATDFQTDLEALANDKTLEESYYGHFSIDKNAILHLKQTPGFQQVRTFYYNYFEDNQALKDLVETYQMNNNQDQITFKIFTGDGAIF